MLGVATYACNSQMSHNPILRQHRDILKVKYFAARVSGAPADQSQLLRRRTEEKGLDVNLAAHLLNDSRLDAYDCGVLVSNDSDVSGVRYGDNGPGGDGSLDRDGALNLNSGSGACGRPR